VTAEIGSTERASGLTYFSHSVTILVWNTLSNPMTIRETPKAYLRMLWEIVIFWFIYNTDEK
jgi:hypothetical protein